jgi:hypothetical protein
LRSEGGNVKSLLAVFLSASVVLAAGPRAYLSISSAYVAGGYHTLIPDSGRSQFAWLSAGTQGPEGILYLTPRLGVGLRLYDVGLTPYIGSTGGFSSMVAVFTPVVSWIAHQGKMNFGYLNLAVMPYWSGRAFMGGRFTASAVALDYSYVPWAPWPLESRVRLSALSLTGAEHQVIVQLSAGVRAGLGWWFMRREGPAQN